MNFEQVGYILTKTSSVSMSCVQNGKSIKLKTDNKPNYSLKSL